MYNISRKFSRHQNVGALPNFPFRYFSPCGANCYVNSTRCWRTTLSSSAFSCTAWSH